MKRFLATVAALGAMTLGALSVAQTESKGDGFIGIWQLIDNGVLVTADISDIDGDGQYRCRVHVDFNSACNEPGELGRQLISPLNPATVNASGDLVMDVKITCPLTERVLEERTPITLRLIDENTLLNVTRDAPFQRINTLRK
jgi:hypothetical protein